MDEKQIQYILEKYKDVFDALEEYDRTGKLGKFEKTNLELKDKF